MSLRDLTLTGIVFGLLPFCLTRPWIGVLVWSWLGYMNPHRLTWGFAYTMPFAQLVAITTFGGLLFTKDRKPLPRAAEVYLLAVLWALFLVTTLHAFNPTDAWTSLEKVSKILLITFLTIVLFQDPRKLRMLFYVIALSIGYYGLKGGIWALMTGGGNQVMGPPESFIAGNTEMGLALNIVLPMLLFLSRDEPRRWLRHLLRIVFVFSVVATLFTYSRGALVGLAVVLPLMLLKGRAKLIVLPSVLVLAFFAQPLARAIMPHRWLDRMGTITTYEADLSARMRLNAWYVSYRIAVDHPFLGGGFRPFAPHIYLAYSPEELLNDFQDAHSIYFQVLAEHGFVGLGLYVGLIVSTLISLRQVMRRTRAQPRLQSFHNTAHMLALSMVGFLVGGAFLSMSYFDLFFHLVAISIILKVLVREATARPIAAPARTAAAVAASTPEPLLELQREAHSRRPSLAGTRWPVVANSSQPRQGPAA